MKGKIFQNKKAVSPLIATVLLIAFAVALGAVVMNWGSDYVKQTAKSTSAKSDADIRCSTETDLNIIELDGRPKLCYNSANKEIEFILENRANTNAEGIQVTVFGAPSTITRVLFNETFAKGDVKKLSVSYDKDVNGTIKLVRFVPLIRVRDITEPVLCTKNPYEKIGDLPACE